MNTTRWAVALVCALAVSFVTPAWSQLAPRCFDSDKLATDLEANFGEAVTAIGVNSRGRMVQVFSSARGTFTIVLTSPGGPSCIVDSGDSWFYEEPKPKGKAS